MVICEIFVDRKRQGRIIEKNYSSIYFYPLVSKFYFVTIYVFDATDKYDFDLDVDLKACDVEDW